MASACPPLPVVTWPHGCSSHCAGTCPLMTVVWVSEQPARRRGSPAAKVGSQVGAARACVFGAGKRGHCIKCCLPDTLSARFHTKFVGNAVTYFIMQICHLNEGKLGSRGI